MSERTDKVKPSSEKLTVVEVMVKSSREWSFAVGVGEKFVVKRKAGDKGPALEVTDAPTVHDVLFFCPTKSK